MRHAVMPHVLSTVEYEFAIAAVDDILWTLFIVVMSQLGHRCQILGAEDTVVVLELVSIIITVVDTLVAVWAGDYQLGK